MFGGLFDKFFKHKHEQPLTQSQREAFIDALVFAVMADGEMAEEEREELNLDLDEISWEGDSNRELFISESIERVSEATVSADAARAYVRDIGARLQSDELRERAYAASSRIVCADHDVAEAERGLMSIFIQEFDLDRERAKNIAANAHRDFDLL